MIREKFVEWRRKDKVGFISLIFLGIFIFVAVFADFIAPYGLNETTYDAVRVAPSAVHLLGTDDLGRDILSRILFASRTSLLMGFIPTTINMVIGTSVGMISAMSPKWLDTIIMRIVDIVLSYPFMILAMAIVYNLGPSTRNLLLTLILTGWAEIARTVRAQTMSLKESTYVEAAKTMGVGKFHIMVHHILPNMRAMLLVIYTMKVPGNILAEAGLSYLGFGAQPPMTSLGVMVSKGRKFLFDAPWISLAPAVYILLLSMCLNFLGDSIRDYVDAAEGRRKVF